MSSAKKILADAASAASALLPELHQRKKILLEELNTVEKEIAGMESIISSAKSYQDQLLAHAASTPPVQKPQLFKNEEGTRASRGKVEEYIDEALVAGIELTASEIMDKIFAQRGVKIGRSSLYTNLQKGAESSKYQQEKGKWRTVVNR